MQKLASSPMLLKLAESMNYSDLEALHAAIGDGHVSAQARSRSAWPASCAAATTRSNCPATARQPRREPTRRQTVGVYVEGLDDVMIRLSRCCTPVPGDEIIGFVTRGRGVSVHRADCANAASLAAGGDGERIIEVEWDREPHRRVRRLDRGQGARPHRVCWPTSPACSPTTTSTSSSSRPRPAATASRRMRFDFELADPAHLDSLAGRHQAHRQRLRRIPSPARQRRLTGHTRRTVRQTVTPRGLIAIDGGSGRSRLTRQ